MKNLWNSIKGFYHNMVYDPVSGKVGSKRYMALVSIHLAWILILIDQIFSTGLDYFALSALFLVAGFNIHQGRKEKAENKTLVSIDELTEKE